MAKFAKKQYSPQDHLLENFPNLTRMELKVCLAMLEDKSTQEIAEQFGLSVRSIENHRYRIRQKIGLKSGQNLSVYLLRVVAFGKK